MAIKKRRYLFIDLHRTGRNTFLDLIDPQQRIPAYVNDILSLPIIPMKGLTIQIRQDRKDLAT